MTATDPNRVGSRTSEDLKRRFLDHVHYTQGKRWDAATPHDMFLSLAFTIRDFIMDRKIATQSLYEKNDVKRVYFLSLEYLLGTSMRNNLVNLGLLDACKEGLEPLGIDLNSLMDLEPDAGLGNGGLGRLAACFLDSLATLEMPAYGYGIRYEYGMFEQEIRDGWQVERPDNWLRHGSPWEIARPEFSVPIKLYGHVEDHTDQRGRYNPHWIAHRTVMGLPYDMTVVGYDTNTVNLLRLWSARSSMVLDLDAFNRGGYMEAVREKALNETISKVLYPNDNNEMGKELRLVQQYFFVACTIADIFRRYDQTHDNLDEFPDKVAIQLNDTHPSVAVVELMRVLLDERGLGWDRAWDITTATLGYTNHTLMPEALEVWPIDLFSRVLPRHTQIVYEINKRFLNDVVERRWPEDDARREKLSIIQDSPVRAVRMANLAIVGSHSVNGVAELHSELIKTRLVPEFAELWPEKFSNKTNGVTPRRFLHMCNPRLSHVISRRIGSGWIKDLEQLKKLEDFKHDPEFLSELQVVKRENKKRLTGWISHNMGLKFPVDALFDVQIKRLHEYKRQLMNIIQVVMRYHSILDRPHEVEVPRVVLFGAKAAPAYTRAKLIIKLINNVADVVNRDERTNHMLKVAFLPNYRVSLAELIIPAADLSEQISTAGMEASGTGNMKFAMNGALTIGTLDGANIEIRDAVGKENFFLFGLTEKEVAEQKPNHDPWVYYHDNDALKRALDAIAFGGFSPDQPDLFKPIYDWLLTEGDYYMTMSDIASYVETQAEVDHVWQNENKWSEMVACNIARIGQFSSDRTIREYARDIWKVKRTSVELI
jgi:starch phosphorylase